MATRPNFGQAPALDEDRFMWRALSLRACLLLLTLAATACGGSASETPWPAEPEAPPPGPLNENVDEPAEDDAGAPPPVFSE